jgi:hypothetical protein
MPGKEWAPMILVFQLSKITSALARIATVIGHVNILLYKLWSSSLWRFLQPFIISTPVVPNNFLSLLPELPQYVVFLWGETKFHTKQQVKLSSGIF